MLDLASHRAFVTGELYVPGHKLMGFRIEELASMGGELSNGEVIVETTGIVFVEEGSDSWSLESESGLALENDLA